MPINFACKKITEEELFKCVFNLNKTSYKVLTFLLKKEDKLTIVEIANELKLKRCAIQRTIKWLLKQGLINRTQRNLERGGYIYLYYCKEKKQTEKKIENLIKQWYESSLLTLKNFSRL